MLVDGVSQKTFSLFQTFYIFHPEPWRNDPIWWAYFSNGLVQPPTRLHIGKLKAIDSIDDARSFFVHHCYFSSPNKPGYMSGEVGGIEGGGPYETLTIETWEWYFFMWHCSRTKLVCWAVADGQSSKKNFGFDGFRRNLRHRYVSIKTTSFLFIMFILLLLKDNEGALPSPFSLAAIWITSESAVYRPHTCDMFCFTNPTGFIPNWHCQSSRITFIRRFDANLHQKGVANGFLAFLFLFS